MNTYWFDRWGLLDDMGSSDDPLPAIKVYEQDLLAPGVSFGAKTCALLLRFLACHDDLDQLNRTRLAEMIDADVGTVSRWLRELSEAGLLREYAGTWVDPAEDGYVYFVQSVHGGPIKIGTGADPERRLTQLQTGHPEPLKILAVVKGGVTLERKLHERFASSRIHGEWFQPTSELVKFVEDVGQIRSTIEAH